MQATRTLTVELTPLAPWLAGPCCVRVPAGATVADVLGVLRIAPPADIAVGIWGRTVPVGQVLEAGDRIEFTRPLRADPKAARRARVRRSK